MSKHFHKGGTKADRIQDLLDCLERVGINTPCENLDRLTYETVMTLQSSMELLEESNKKLALCMQQGATLLARLEECQKRFEEAKERRVPRIPIIDI